MGCACLSVPGILDQEFYPRASEFGYWEFMSTVYRFAGLYSRDLMFL